MLKVEQNKRTFILPPPPAFIRAGQGRSILSYKAFFSISTFKILTMTDNLTYACFVYWCMHLYLHNLVPALTY